MYDFLPFWLSREPEERLCIFAWWVPHGSLPRRVRPRRGGGQRRSELLRERGERGRRELLFRERGWSDHELFWRRRGRERHKLGLDRISGRGRDGRRVQLFVE